MLAFATGERLALSSPVAPAGSSVLVVPLQRSQQWLSTASGGAWFSTARADQVAYLAVDGGELLVRFHSADVPAGLLTIVGRPLDPGGRQCQPMQIVLDGQPLTLGAIWPAWRSYPVALPSIGPGAHELRIRYHDRTAVPDRPVFAVNRIAFARGAFERLLDSLPAVARHTGPVVDGASNGG